MTFEDFELSTPADARKDSFTKSESIVDDIVQILFASLKETDESQSRDCLRLDCLNADVAPSVDSGINDKRPSDRFECVPPWMDMLSGTGPRSPTVQECFPTMPFLQSTPESDHINQIGSSPTVCQSFDLQYAAMPISAPAQSARGDYVDPDNILKSVTRGARGQLAYDPIQLDDKTRQRVLRNRASARLARERRLLQRREEQAELQRQLELNAALRERLQSAMRWIEAHMDHTGLSRFPVSV